MDIDKIEKFPLTFVIKSEESIEAITEKLKAAAQKTFSVTSVVAKYMDCIEEVINIPVLKKRFAEVVAAGKATDVLSEIIVQSKVEFNIEESEEDSLEDLEDE